MTTDDFAKLAPLVTGYELQPGKHYLFIADGKKFNYDLAKALSQNMRDHHPELTVFVIGTLEPKALEIRETTLADQIVAVEREWLDEQPPTPAGTQNFITAILPLLNRAIKVLQGTDVKTL